MTLLALLEHTLSNAQYSVNESISEFTFRATLSYNPNLSTKFLEDFLDIVSETDSFELSINIEENSPISFYSRKSNSEFLKKLEDEFKFHEEEEKVFINLIINKKEQLTIYSFDHFSQFWLQTTPLEILEALSVFLKTNTPLIFKLTDSDVSPFGTSLIQFGALDLENNERKINLKEHCHFSNLAKYPFTPDYFHLVKRPSVNNSITDKLDILTTLFSIIAICDITTLNQGKLEYKLNGYKTIEGSLPIDGNLQTNSEIYFSIYSWTYSNSTHVADKLGLTRNVLSIYLIDNILQVSNKILPSIKSAHKTYLKENINRYISIRADIFKELGWISQKSSEVVDGYLLNYKRSILSFVSFFASVFILKVLKSDSSSIQVFGKEATLISFAFLFVSGLYLLFSALSIQLNKSRLERKYQNVKKRYKDLLIEDDINRILDNDSEFNYEKEFIKKRTRLYTILWIATITTLAIAVTLSSNYASSCILKLLSQMFLSC